MTLKPKSKDDAVLIPVGPRVTGIGVKTSDDHDGQPLSVQIDSNGKANLVVNEGLFVENVFRGLEIKAGKYKGQLLTEDVVAEAVEYGKELLQKEDLFEEGVAEAFDDFQKNIAARIVSPVEAKRKELKDPVNKIGKIFQGMPALVLGELLEIQDEVKVRNRAYRAEKEKRDREAAQADAQLRTETAGQLARVSSLAGSLAAGSADDIQNALDRLETDNFEPHAEFTVQYADAVAGAASTLAIMLKDVKKKEAAAAAEAEAEAKRQAERDAELAALKKQQAAQAEKQAKQREEQQLKDDAAAALLEISDIYMECSEGSSADCDDALSKMARLIDKSIENPYFENERVDSYYNKMDAAKSKAVLKEEEKEKAETKAKAEAEEAEAHRIEKELAEREAENHRLLEKAGYSLGDSSDGENTIFEKNGRRIFSLSELKRVESEYVKSEINKFEKILKEEAAREEAEAKDIAEKEAAEEKARKDTEANRAKAEQAMSDAILACESHEEIISAIKGGGIPHVKFDAAPVEG